MFGHIREFHPVPRRKEGRMQAAGEGTSNTTGRGREARHTGPAADEPGRLRGGRVDGRRRGWGPRRSVNRPWTCPATGPGDAARPARFTKSAACAHFQNAAYDVSRCLLRSAPGSRGALILSLEHHPRRGRRARLRTRSGACRFQRRCRSSYKVCV